MTALGKLPASVVLGFGLALGLAAQAPAARTLDLRNPALGNLQRNPASQTAASVKSQVHKACATCHRSHNVPRGGEKKLIKTASVDELCLPCHEPGKSAFMTELAPKLPAWTGGEGSGHLKGRFSSRRTESYSRVVTSDTGQRVQLAQDCAACHDSHGRERGKLRRLGFDNRGQLMDRRPQSVAEVCFGCHAGQEAALLRSSTPDLGLLFSKGAMSSHRIGATAAGRPELPSLRSGLHVGGLDCTSCHDNPDPGGARGPHASPHVALLKASYGRERDMARLGERVNDLCLACHDRTSILANQSFAFHAQHLKGFTTSSAATGRMGPQQEAQAALGIRTARDLRSGRSGGFIAGRGEPTACATCHASHGSLRQAVLVEFDSSVVGPSSLGAPIFQRTGLGHGTCTLSCHGYDHVQTRY